MVDEPETAHTTPTLSIDEEGIARVTFADPERSVNVLTEAVMRRLADLTQELQTRADAGEVKGVLFLSEKSSFIVGADIDAIAAVESPDEGALAARLGQSIYLEVERLPVPTVAAIHGTCMGGGTELALACRYRLASDHPSTKIGLPEVQLGILPAWGGTTRLPRLIGLRAALDLLLTGKTVDGRGAGKRGLVEAVLPHGTFHDEAAAFLRERIEHGQHPTGARRGFTQKLLEDTAPGRRLILSMARNQVMSRTGGHYPAPLRILEVIRRSAGRSLEKGFELEAEAAGELLVSSISKNLVHLFHLREGAKKGAGLPKVEGPEIEHVGVVGAGVMGGGVAHLVASRGLQVRLKDIRHDAVGQALKHAEDLFRKGVKRRKLTEREAGRAMERISGSTQYAGFGTVDLVVEAVVEKMEVKRSVLAEVEERVPENCILTTNTSTLSIDEMAGALSRPERFCGMHFFNPVHKMPLIEVIQGSRTDAGTVAAVHALALRLGKVPVVVGDGPGFLVNRILGPYMNEAGHLLSEGASVEAIDRAAVRFGMPMGPLRLMDEVGIDVARHAGRVLHEALGKRMTPADPLVALGETERLGRKGGLGFYRYDGDEEKGVDSGIYQALGSTVPSERSELPEDDVRARLVLCMINEAARVLEEGIARSAGDVDLAMIMGTGFPPFRGGLLRFADEHHPRYIVERLEGFQRAKGTRFEPAPLLRRLAADDEGFYDAFPGASP